MPHALVVRPHLVVLDDQGSVHGHDPAILVVDLAGPVFGKHVEDRLADVLLGGDAVHLLHGAVQNHDPAVLVLHHHRRRRVLQDAVEEGPPAAHLLFGVHLDGHVPRHDQKPADIAAIVPPRGRVPHHPAVLAVGQDHALGAAADGLAGEAALVKDGVLGLGVGREFV